MIGTAFGYGTPLGYPTQQLNPYGTPFFGAQGTLAVQNPNIPQTTQQVVQLLQFIPQQLQQLQQLQQQQFVQHQQLQQVLQAIPAQLAQLQQLIQFVPHQIQQQLQQQGASFQQQPFGQIAGNTGYGISTPWGIAPPAIGAQPSHVM